MQSINTFGSSGLGKPFRCTARKDARQNGPRLDTPREIESGGLYLYASTVRISRLSTIAGKPASTSNDDVFGPFTWI
jgi:hypothetical protein